MGFEVILQTLQDGLRGCEGVVLVDHEGECVAAVGSLPHQTLLLWGAHATAAMAPLLVLQRGSMQGEHGHAQRQAQRQAQRHPGVTSAARSSSIPRIDRLDVRTEHKVWSMHQVEEGLWLVLVQSASPYVALSASGWSRTRAEILDEIHGHRAASAQ